jgi:hypothetical protein
MPVSIAVLLVYHLDTPRTSPITRDWVQIIADNVDYYYQRQSGQRENPIIKVFDWVRLPETYKKWASYGIDDGESGIKIVAAVQAALGVDLSGFQHFGFIIDVPDNSAGAFFPALNTKYGHFSARDFTPAFFAHEVGHLFNKAPYNGHANLDTPGGPMEYGDQFCIMGAEGSKFSSYNPINSYVPLPERNNWQYCGDCRTLYHATDSGPCPSTGANHVQGKIYGKRITFWLTDDQESEVAQRSWKRCRQCNTLYFAGFSSFSGVCSASERGHEPDSSDTNMSLRHYYEVPKTQADWRFCVRCAGLFYEGSQASSVCPAPGGGPHQAMGLNFTPHFDGVSTPTSMKEWYQCKLCHGLFSDDLTSSAGECPAGTQHQLAGPNYSLRHSVPPETGFQSLWKRCAYCRCLFYRDAVENHCPTGGNHLSINDLDFSLPFRVQYPGQLRPEWRYCYKCASLFFNGEENKGHCPANPTTGHVAAGYEFLLLELKPDYSAEGPGMCAPSLLHCGWLDLPNIKVAIDMSSELLPRPKFTTIRLKALDGAPQSTYGGPPVVAWADGLAAQRLTIEYRSTATPFDKGLKGNGAQVGSEGSIVVHFVDGSIPLRMTLKIAAFPAQEGAKFVVEQAGLYVRVTDQSDTTVILDLISFVAQPALGQPNWRRCKNCFSLFYDGYHTKGLCRTGGEHIAIRENYMLPHDLLVAGSTQNQWQFCANCNCMIYAGYPLGISSCPAGNLHAPAGYDFVLSHGPSAPGVHGWRFCKNCETMFYDDDPANKGLCKNGGTHVSDGVGFNFALQNL